MKGRAMQKLLRIGLLMGVVLAYSSGDGGAAEWVHEGMAEPGKWRGGFPCRAKLYHATEQSEHHWTSA